jgi:hypothetical protein
MPLPLGVWKANVNGSQGELLFEEVTSQGNVRGSLFNLPLFGLWTEPSQTVVFSVKRQIDAGGGVGLTAEWIPHSFMGYLFSTPAMPQPGQDIVWTLAGSVIDAVGQAINGVAATSRRTHFGWIAQLTQVV